MSARNPKAVLGALMLLSGACSREPPPRRAATEAPRVVSIFSRADALPLQQAACGAGDDACPNLALEDFDCPRDAAAEVLIFSGHSLPPLYLHTGPEALARVAACYRPELIVLDTCYGFSLPLLEALAGAVPGALVVGATYKLPSQGLRYDADFFQPGTADARAERFHTRSGKPLTRWRLDADALSQARDTLEAWDVDALEARLVRKLPNLVSVDLPGADAAALVPVAPERFRR
ncbi:hypothetical protein [Corallococcus exiguus]|uniref:hypothetical protein n=1 Tax=Corallococcus exiguus TaxID=83462 RepID=UPI00147240B9|nr:hypothetical protein [Corallococcus exiguus]NNB84214.1 hypothetical protein [Corallococcus exiguus]